MELPEDRKMQFRIGINLGDIIEEGERIYGDGVNIAARLESLADPGGICISKTAFDHIETKLPPSEDPSNSRSFMLCGGFAVRGSNKAVMRPWA